MEINQLQQQLSAKLDAFIKALPALPVELYSPVAYTLNLGGKRVRPILVMLGTDLFDGNIELAADLALAIELFHNFSLIHDDIMDQAPLRRGKPTVYRKWNPNIAILSGDATLVKAYQLIANANLKPASKVEILKVFNNVALQVCEGQQFDMNYEASLSVTVEQYLTMIKLKTAVLLGGAFQIGALIAEASADPAMAAYEIGLNLGIAFQLQDDYMDVFGDADKFGKMVGGDIKSNKKTYLLLKALELAKNEPAVNQRLQSALQMTPEFHEDKVLIVKEIYIQLGVGELLLRELQNYFIAAQQKLAALPVAPEKKAHLSKFIESLVTRDY